MHDPTPVRILLLLQMLALLGLAGYWASLAAPVREATLLTLMVHEQAQSPPPPALLDQPGWLLEHRLGRLQGMTGLLALALTIGACEGWACRRQDVLGGFRLLPWTLGVLLAALVPGALLAFLFIPSPLPLVGASTALGALGGATAWGLARGRLQTL